MQRIIWINVTWEAIFVLFHEWYGVAFFKPVLSEHIHCS